VVDNLSGSTREFLFYTPIGWLGNLCPGAWIRSREWLFIATHYQPVYRLIEEGHVPGKNFIQVGLRGYYPNKESFE